MAKKTLKTLVLNGGVLLIICGIARGTSGDWLLDPSPFSASVEWRIRLTPNAATVEYRSPVTGRTILRAVKPEARVVFDGKPFAVGGLTGQPCVNYLTPDMLDHMVADPNAYQFMRWEERPVEERFPWKRRKAWISRGTTPLNFR